MVRVSVIGKRKRSRKGKPIGARLINSMAANVMLENDLLNTSWEYGGLAAPPQLVVDPYEDD
jgi:hypothetical protein